MRRWMQVGAVALTLVLAVPMGTTAFGSEEQGLTSVKGLCTGGTTTWDMEVARDVGLEIEFGIDSGIPDQEWHYRLKYNRHILLQGVEVTEEEGDFDVRTVENNAVGEDVVHIYAQNEATGEVCWGQLAVEL
jgi:hypothetical protein